MSQLGFITQLAYSGGQLVGSGLRVSGFNGAIVTVSGNAPALLPLPGVSGQVPTSTQSGYLQWSTPGGASLTSGCVLSGMLAASDTTAAVASGNVASGIIGNVHVRSGGLSSGAIASGSLGNAQVSSGGFLSGAFGSGQIAHPHIASGGVLSGNVASGQLGINHFASGTVADQTLQEAGASLTSFVTPGRQQFHPSALKVWVRFDDAATPNIAASYNVSSITKHSTGEYTITYTTAFSTGNYFICGCGSLSADTAKYVWMTQVNGISVPATGSCRVRYIYDGDGNPKDSDYNWFGAAGDQ